MSKILALKSRKKTVDTIYRASCAMKAAAAIRANRIEKALLESAQVFFHMDKNANVILEKIFLPHAISENAQQKIHILIGCDKGLCGDFISNLTKYFNQKSEQDNDIWFLIGAKLEPLCKEKRIHFLDNLYFDEVYIFQLATKIWDFVKMEKVADLVIHSFVKSHIMFRYVFSKTRAIEQFEDEATEDTIMNKFAQNNNFVMDEEYCILFIASYLNQAILESTLEENKQRVIAVEQAKINAESMGKIIDRLYNRARQEKITFELNEITAGII